MLRKNHSRICDLCVTEWLVVMCDLWWCAHSQVIKMKISCTRMFALFIACVKHLLVQTFVGITCRSQQSRRCSWVTNLKNILWLALTCFDLHHLGIQSHGCLRSNQCVETRGARGRNPQPCKKPGTEGATKLIWFEQFLDLFWHISTIWRNKTVMDVWNWIILKIEGIKFVFSNH